MSETDYIQHIENGEPGFSVRSKLNASIDQANKVPSKEDAVKHHFSATGAPSNGNDTTEGYEQRSLWFDTQEQKLYQCVDATAFNAVWLEISFGADQLGSAAMSEVGDFDPAGSADQAKQDAKQHTDDHANRDDNPHSVTKEQVGLGYVDNTSDEDKPISTAQQQALDDKIDIAAIVDNLLSEASDKPLSAKQGKVLHGYIDSINTLLDSDDTSLDELQEIVDFIKENRETLESLQINNISGLQQALDDKVDKVAGMGLSEESFTSAEKTKLDNIEAEATKNASDADLRDRSTHTGTQTLSSISDAGSAAAAETTDFATASQGQLAESAVQGDGVTMIVAITEEDYDALTEVDPTTVYVIKEDD